MTELLEFAAFSTYDRSLRASVIQLLGVLRSAPELPAMPGCGRPRLKVGYAGRSSVDETAKPIIHRASDGRFKVRARVPVPGITSIEGRRRVKPPRPDT